jgi:hypothetical protein
MSLGRLKAKTGSHSTIPTSPPGLREPKALSRTRPGRPYVHQDLVDQHGIVACAVGKALHVSFAEGGVDEA